jgi:hypothetical protein
MQLNPDRRGNAVKERAMKRSDASEELENRAAAALKAVLAEISTIKVREIRHRAQEAGPDRGLTVQVDIFGRSHTLSCGVHSDGQPGHLRGALEELRSGAAHLAPDATPVIIAPYLSPEAQALCRESKAGYLDLEGNARLALGEVFIVKRTLPFHGSHAPVRERASAETRPAAKFAHAGSAHAVA